MSLPSHLRNLGLRARMIALFAVVALAPLVISNTFGYLSTREILVARGFRNLRDVAARSAVEIDRTLQGWGHALEVTVTAHREEIRAALAADPAVALAALAEKVPPQAARGDELMLVSLAGQVLASTLPMPAAVPPGSPCVGPRAGGGAVEGGSYVTAVALGGHGLVLCRRISLDGHRAELLRVAGVELASPLASPWYAAAPWEGRTRLADGAAALSAYAPIASFRLGVVTSTPLAEVLAVLDELRGRVIVLTAALVVLLVGAVYATARSLTRPLSEVVQAARLTAGGARGARVAASGPPEVVELGETFNKMSQALKASHEELEERIAARTAELARSRAFVDLLFDSIDQMLVVIDRSLRVIKRNRAAERLQGGGGEAEAELARRCFATGERQREERSLRAAGAVEIVAMEASPVCDAQGEVFAVIVIATLATAERRLEAQMVHHEKMATFGLLAAGIAHEIGNPLASIQSQLRLSRGAPEKTAATLSIVEREVERIAALLRELVGFVRRRGEGVHLVGLRQVLEDAAQLVGHDPRRRSVTIEIDAEAGCAVRAKPDELLQVVLNLGLNALDAMPDGGRLTFEARAEGERAALRVRDSGAGVAEEARARLFEPFFTTKPPGRGTGLGLFVSRGIVEGLGGELTLESSGPGGTTFVVRLPREGGRKELAA